MTFERVAKVLAQYRDTEESSITPETKFEDLGLDSLDMVDLLMALEDEFGVEIEAEDGLKTVNDLTEYIDTLLK